MPQQKSYSEMIEDAVLTMGERKGSSRQAIWKCVSTKFPTADFKQFLVRLKKCKADGMLEQIKGKFRLSQVYKSKLLKTLKKGKAVKPVRKSKATLKKNKKVKKAKPVKRS